MHFNSDHEALSILIKINCNDNINFINAEKLGNFMYKKTKWKKFVKDLDDNYSNVIPHNINLTREEIDNHLNLLNLSLQKSIDKCVPRYKPCSNTLYYVKEKINKLHFAKSKLVTTLKFFKRRGHGNNSNLIIALKNAIKETSDKLKFEFKRSYTKYWESQHRLINYRNPDLFFPRIIIKAH